MPTIRDDSAGAYGTWNNDDLSWLDYLTAKASDGSNALANLGRNLAQGFSPIGTSEQGNMALQVPPIVSGIAQSYSNLAGSPSHPGNAYDLTGVPELDAPIQQDMSNVLLSLYGGNAVAGLTKPKGALGAGAMREAGGPIKVFHGTTKQGPFEQFTSEPFLSERPDIASMYAGVDGYQGDRIPETSHVYPLMIDPQNPYFASKEVSPWEIPALRAAGHDFIIRDNMQDVGGVQRQYQAIAPNTVRSATTGETLFSDNRPSLLGSALATAGENYDLPPWLQF